MAIRRPPTKTCLIFDLASSRSPSVTRRLARLPRSMDPSRAARTGQCRAIERQRANGRLARKATFGRRHAHWRQTPSGPSSPTDPKPKGTPAAASAPAARRAPCAGLQRVERLVGVWRQVLGPRRVVHAHDDARAGRLQLLRDLLCALPADDDRHDRELAWRRRGARRISRGVDALKRHRQRAAQRRDHRRQRRVVRLARRLGKRGVCW